MKYIDNRETKHKLHIVLEFIENGSLQGVYTRSYSQRYDYSSPDMLFLFSPDIVKKFGAMKEELVAKYIYQVLKGLE